MLNGTYAGRWPRAMECAEWVDGIPWSIISMLRGVCCSSQPKTTGGFISSSFELMSNLATIRSAAGVSA